MSSRDLPPEKKKEPDAELLALAQDIANELNFQKGFDIERDYFQELKNFCMDRGLNVPSFVYKKLSYKGSDGMTECTVTVRFPGLEPFSITQRDSYPPMALQRAAHDLHEKLKRDMV